MLPVAILAGGIATRLRPITETIPKALVEIAGKPFLAWQLTDLARQGITQVVLCVGYLSEQIEAVIGDGSEYGIEVSYAYDGPVLLGTGGALKKALPKLGDSFFVLYGDSFLQVNYQAVENAYRASGLPALMTVLRNGNQWDKSNVFFAGGKVLEYNKHTPKIEMEFIDYGLSILSSSVFASYPADKPFDLAEVYHFLSVNENLAGLEVFNRFYEMGSHQGLKETEAYFLREKQA